MFIHSFTNLLLHTFKKSFIHLFIWLSFLSFIHLIVYLLIYTYSLFNCVHRDFTISLGWSVIRSVGRSVPFLGSGQEEDKVLYNTGVICPPVFYRTSFPSGPLPCFISLHFTITQSRATGIADHILPLGDLLRLLLLPRCPCDLLQHCSCPPARDWGSCVSGLVSLHVICLLAIIYRSTVLMRHEKQYAANYVTSTNSFNFSAINSVEKNIVKPIW